jgi:hypothetical protein
MAMATARQPSHWAVIGVEALIGVNAIYGGVGLIRDGMGMVDRSDVLGEPGRH